MSPVLSLGALLLAACVTSTDPGSSTLAVQGTWDYSASQTSPAATLTGTLTITAQSRGSFQGTASVVENDGGGTTPLTGAITGQTVNDTTVDFDVFFDANARRHVATVVRDTMRGGWFESQGSTTLSGSFIAIRRSGP